MRFSHTLSRGLGGPVALALALFGTAQTAPAQSAADIFNAAIEEYEERASRISGYTLTQDAMGFETTLDFEKQMVDGHPIFVPVSEEGTDDDISGWGNFYRMYTALADRARLDGSEAVDGEECYVLVIDDLADLELDEQIFAGGNQEFAPQEGTFYIDMDDTILRKSVIRGTSTAEGQTTPFEMEVLFMDWRDVDGWLHPFHMLITTQGTPPGMTEEQLADARQSLQQMQEQLGDMPESQRAALQGLMGPQMERLQAMLESGQFEIEVRTKELTVR